jgi:hypothetical protein
MDDYTYYFLLSAEADMTRERRNTQAGSVDCEASRGRRVRRVPQFPLRFPRLGSHATEKSFTRGRASANAQKEASCVP